MWFSSFVCWIILWSDMYFLSRILSISWHTGTTKAKNQFQCVRKNPRSQRVRINCRTRSFTHTNERSTRTIKRDFVDTAAPTTSFQLRLVDGTHLASRFNSHHTIRHLHGRFKTMWLQRVPEILALFETIRYMSFSGCVFVASVENLIIDSTIWSTLGLGIIWENQQICFL